MLSKLNLTWKFTLRYLVLCAASAIAIGGTVHSHHVAERHQQTLNNLRLHTDWIIKSLGKSGETQASENLQESLNSLDRQINLRITAMDSRGVVLADSRANAATMDNHLLRPEVQEALQAGDGWGQAKRFSATLASEFTYVAKKLPQEQVAGLAILRTAAVENDQPIIPFQLPFYLSIAIIGLICLSLTLGRLNAQSLKRPLEKIADTALQHAAGDLQKR